MTLPLDSRRLGFGALLTLSVLGTALGDDFVAPAEGECVGPVTTAVVTHRGGPGTLELNGTDVTGAFTPCPGTSSSGVYLGNPPATHSPKRGGYFLRLNGAVPGGPFFAIQGAAQIESLANGDLRLSANLVSTRHPNKTFEAQVLLRPSAAPTKVLRELYRWNYAPWGPIRPGAWDSYAVVPAGSRLTGTGALTGFDLTLRPHPAQGGAGFKVQRGLGANGRTLGQGLGGKLAFSGSCYGSARLLVDELRESTLGNPSATHSPKPGGYFLELGDNVPGGPRFAVAGTSSLVPQVNGDLILNADLASVSDPSKGFRARILLRPSWRGWISRDLWWFLYAPFGPIKPYTWSFYRVDPSGSSLTGLGALAGTNLTLQPHPAGGGRRFRIQRGEGANGRNLSAGLGGKLAYSGDYSGTARLIADEFQETCLQAPLGSLPGIQEGANTITLDVNGQQTALRNFLYDSIAPTTSVTITSTQDPLELRIDYADSGCASLDLASLRVFLDGNEVTAAFSPTAASATATLPRPPPGTHTLEVRLADSLGNSGTTTTPFTLDPLGSAVALELRLSPGSGALAVAGSSYDLVVRALTAEGGTAPDFVGTVLIGTNQGQAPLHGAVATFTPGDQGLVTLSGVGFFPTTGLVWISAGGGSPAVSGQLSVTVVAGDPVIFPELPPATQSGTQVVSGVSFPGQFVQVVVDGAVVATTTAGPDGSYSVSITLAEGDHQVAVQGFDPQGGGFVTSLLQSVRVDTQAASPTLVTPPPGAVVANQSVVSGVAEAGALVEVLEGGSLLGSGVADGFGRFVVAITFPASGSHSITVRQTDPAGNLSPPSPPREVLSGQAPIVLQAFDAGSDRPGPLAGSPVEIAGSLSATTDAQGRAVILDPPTGPQVLAIDARPRHVRLELAVTPTAGEVVRVERALLYRVPAGVASVVSLSGGVVQQATSVVHPTDPNAALLFPAGTTVGGAGSDFPQVAIFPVDPSFAPAALPAGFAPSRLYELSPSGLTFSPGITVRFPNHAGLAPGTQRQIYGYKASLGGWSPLGQATVDPTGSFLETDTNFVDGFSLYGFDDGNAISTLARLRVNDLNGSPLTGLSISVNGQSFVDKGDGSYEVGLTLSAGQPLRASFSVHLPGQPLSGPGIQVTLSPTLPDPGLTDLGTFELATLIQGECGLATAGGQVGEATPSNELTHATLGALVTSGDVGVPPEGVFAGLLHKAFPQSRLTCPTDESGVFFEITGLPPGTAASPNTKRFLPFRIELYDFDEDSDGVVTLRYDLDQSGSWVSATLATGLGDPTTGRLGTLGGVEHLFVWDSRDPATGVGALAGAVREVRFEVTVSNNGGADTQVLTSGSFWIADPPFELLSSDPTQGQLEVEQNDRPRLVFSSPVDLTTLSGNVLLNGGSLTIDSFSPFSGGHGIEIKPAAPLPAMTSVSISVGAGLLSTTGVPATPTTVIFGVGNDLGEVDSDDDGLLDKEEARYGTNPSSADSDGDGWDDFEEIFVRGTSPTEADTDGDGLPDATDPDPFRPADGSLADPTNLFQVLSIDPLPGATMVPPNPVISITFTRPIERSSVVITGPETNFTLTNRFVIQPSLTGTPVFSNGDRTVSFSTTGVFQNTTFKNRYDLTILSGAPGARLLTDTDGNALAGVDPSLPLSTFYTEADVSQPIDDFEQIHYMEGLAYSKWERFPLTSATAGGRSGVAMVVPSTGRLLIQETDFVLPGRMTSVALTRTYRSNAGAQDGIFGKNWHCNYDMRFEVVSSVNGDSVPDLRHVSADGRPFTYLRNSLTNIADSESPTGFYDSLHVVANPNGTGSFLLKQRTDTGIGFYYEFRDASGPVHPNAALVGDRGYLVRIRDTNGNDVVINRYDAGPANVANQISDIVDDRGRMTQFVYHSTPGKQNLVAEVQQHWDASNRREWIYDYDANGRLNSVATPTTDFRPEGASADSSGRKNRSYGYEGTGTQRNLTSVTDGRGNTTLRVLYSNDLVSQVDYGVGADAGTAIYAFERRDTVTIGDSNVFPNNFETLPPAYTALQVDRNRHVNVLEHTPVLPPAGAPVRSVISRSRIANEQLNETTTLADFLTILTTNPRGRVVKVLWVDGFDGLIPFGVCVCFVRVEAECDNAVQVIWKSADGDHNKDIVRTYSYDPVYHTLIECKGARANNNVFVGNGPCVDIVDTLEDPVNGIPRTFKNIDEAARERYTTRIYYDHENIAARLAQDSADAGVSVTLASTLPPTFGRPANGQFNDPPGAPFADADGDGFPDRGGNVIAIRGPQPQTVDPANSSDFLGTQVIETSAAYNQCGQRFLQVEPDGQRNRFSYFTAPPSVGYPRSSTQGTGFGLADFNLITGEPLPGADPFPDAITSEILEYDAFGNVTRARSPRGFESTLEVNALNLVTKVTSPGPFFYERQFSHDANNNLVESRVQNVIPTDGNNDGQYDPGEQAVVTGREFFVNEVTYNSVNMPLEARVDASEPDGPRKLLTTRFAYDRKQLLIAVREPMGNMHTRRYDERDLLLETYAGASDPATQTLTRTCHDNLGRVVVVQDADGDDTTPQLRYTYDEFNRVTRVTNELQHYSEVSYDVSSRVVETRSFEFTNTINDKLLSRSRTAYDEAGRPFQTSAELFADLGGPVNLLAEAPNHGLPVPLDLTEGPQGTDTMLDPAPFGSSSQVVNALVFYDVEGKVLETRDDNDHRASMTYDGLDRVQTVTDQLGSSVRYVYDRASNVIRTITTEQEELLPGAGGTGRVETYYAERFYDQLNRLTAVVSHQGNTSRFLYDSRNNLVQSSDAQGSTAPGASFASLDLVGDHGSVLQESALTAPAPTVTLNHRGNTIRMIYDGASRPLAKIEDLRQGGVRQGEPIGEIRTSQKWDDNSRLVSRTDPQLNETNYVYDHQNRRIRELFADGTDCRYAYNAVGTLASKVDPRGVCEKYTYDLLERLISTEVTGAPAGEGQNTSYAYTYDGLNRVLESKALRPQEYAGENFSSTTRDYDSFSRVIRETQAGNFAVSDGAGGVQEAGYTGVLNRWFDGVGNLMLTQYPSGRDVRRSYDPVDRLAEVIDEGGPSPRQLAAYSHIGMGSRRLRRDYSEPGIACSLDYDASRRLTQIDDLRGGARINGFRYAWDRANNRRFELELTSTSPSDTTSGQGSHYRYDSAYRLVREDVGASGAELLTITNNEAALAPPVIGTASSVETWTLDAAGNRTQTQSGGVVTNYMSALAGAFGDREVNQITAISTPALGADREREHDEAGNVVREDRNGSQEVRRFDHQSRLVQVEDPSAGTNVRYTYDAEGRRRAKAEVAGDAFRAKVFFWDGWRCIEERELVPVTGFPAALELVSEFVHGEGLDEVVFARVLDPADPDGPANGLDRIDLFYCHNSLGSVTAVTDSGGNVVERYAYEAYGKTTILNPDRTVKSSQVPVQPYGFTGRRMDCEEGSGLYFYRLRYYDPEAGRFISRDPLGMWGDTGQRGNAQNYCGNNPVNRVDPLGEWGMVAEAVYEITKAMAQSGAITRGAGARAVLTELTLAGAAAHNAHPLAPATLVVVPNPNAETTTLPGGSTMLLPFRNQVVPPELMPAPALTPDLSPTPAPEQLPFGPQPKTEEEEKEEPPPTYEVAVRLYDFGNSDRHAWVVTRKLVEGAVVESYMTHRAWVRYPPKDWTIDDILKHNRRGKKPYKTQVEYLPPGMDPKTTYTEHVAQIDEAEYLAARTLQMALTLTNKKNKPVPFTSRKNCVSHVRRVLTAAGSGIPGKTQTVPGLNTVLTNDGRFK